MAERKDVRVDTVMYKAERRIKGIQELESRQRDFEEYHVCHMTLVKDDTRSWLK